MNRDLFFAVAKIDLREIIGHHQANQLLELTNINHLNTSPDSAMMDAGPIPGREATRPERDTRIP